MEKKDYRVKTKPPVRLIIGLILLGTLLLGGIIGGTLYYARSFGDMRLRGVVVDKEFVPMAERRIVVGERGISERTREGDFIVTVAVRQREDAEPREYRVFFGDRESFDAVSVGDEFDVGPFLVNPPPNAPKPAVVDGSGQPVTAE